MSGNVIQWNDARLRNIMGSLLRFGVFTAAFLVILGGILFFVQHPKEIFDFSTMNAPGKFLHKTLSNILSPLFRIKTTAGDSFILVRQSTRPEEFRTVNR